MNVKRVWRVFWDLQCPYSRANWQNMPAIQEQFRPQYDFSIHLTSLAFHYQAFPGQCAATLIGSRLGEDARLEFINACYENQSLYTKEAVGDARPSEIDAIFCNIAKEAGLLNSALTPKDFLGNVRDWDKVVKPAWAEHKIALGYGVFGAPKHVIDERLIDGTESAWGVEEWIEKLKDLS